MNAYQNMPKPQVNADIPSTAEEPQASSSPHYPLRGEHFSHRYHHSSVFPVSEVYKTMKHIVLCQCSVAQFYAHEIHSCSF